MDTKIETHNTKDNSNTTKNNKKIKKSVWIVLLCLILTSLIFSYIFLFSGVSKNWFFSTKSVGVLHKDNFHNANWGDLLVIDNVNTIIDLNNEDVIVYKLNGQIYSRKIVDINTKSAIIEVEDGLKTKKVSFDIVLGKQGKIIPILGMFIGFFASNLGVIVLSLLILLLVVLYSVKKLSYEDTEYGNELLKKYKENKKIIKERNQVLKKYNKNGLTINESSIIDGKLGDNLIGLLSFSSNEEKINTNTQAYLYILEKIYKTYITKESLSRRDKKRISNVVELSPVVDNFNEIISYKLIDLLLVEKVYDFDISGFEKLSLKFLNKNIYEEDLMNFGNVLYVLICKNEKLRGAHFKKIINQFCEKAVVYDKNEYLVKLVEKLKSFFYDSIDIKKLKNN